MGGSPASDAYADWLNGDIDEIPALRAMQRALDAIDRELGGLEAQRNLWRSRIAEVVCHAGGKVAIGGLAEYRMTEPGQVVTYDRKEIEKLLHLSLEAGDIGTARAIQYARKVTERASTLQIRKEKK